MNNPLISVIIPVYNVENYLHKCIDSIINQTYKNIDIVLVNDGSTDNCLNICEDYRRLDSRITVINKKNEGVSVARNKGLEIAKGDYIIFLDSDDYWNDDKALNGIVNQINEVQADVIIFGYRKYFEDIDRFSNIRAKCDREELLNSKNQLSYLMRNKCYGSSPWDKVIKKELLKENNLIFRKGVFCEDIEWNAKLAMYTKTYDYYDNDFLVYVQRKNSITKCKSEKLIDDLFNNIKICVEMIENKNEKNLKEKIEINNYLAFQYCTLLVYLGGINIKNKKNKFNEISKYKYLLRYGFDSRVKSVYYSSNILGIKITSVLLALYHKYRR